MSTAPITLWTGLPGNGKTAHVVAYMLENVERWQREGRQLYVSGIPDLTVPHEVLEDPATWHELPTGAVIVIDECQRAFRPRANGSAVPPHVAALETIRHSGKEIILITQHPNLIDGNVRRLVGRHNHVERKFGSHMVLMLSWEGAKDPTSKAERKVCEKKTVALPKHAFGAYKSAEIHTIKRRIPNVVWYVLILAVLTVVLFYYVSTMFLSKKPESQASDTEQLATSTGVVPTAPTSPVAHTKTALEWYQERTPRLNGMPHTAPAYDGITAPTVAPKPVACVMTPKRCSCYSQQGTKLPTVEDKSCREIAENGYFDDSPEKQQPMQQQQMQQPKPLTQQVTDVQPYPTRSTVQDGTGQGDKWPVGNPPFKATNPYRS